MTELSAVDEVFATLGGQAARISYEVLDSETPNVRHIIALTEDGGLNIQKIDEEADQLFPRRSKGERVVSELDSFLAELSRRPLDERGTLWGTASGGKLTAVYNDHDVTPYIGGWRDDKLTLQLKADPDWAQWHTISGKYYGQSDFGDIVEELLHTVVSPDQAELLEIIDSIRASSKGQFESSITRANGGQNLTYNTEISATAGKATNQLAVPQFVTLELRPWDGHPTTYRVDAYFRIKVDNGRLLLTIKLKPTRWIIREAWEQITNTVRETVDKPVYAQ